MNRVFGPSFHAIVCFVAECRSRLTSTLKSDAVPVTGQQPGQRPELPLRAADERDERLVSLRAHRSPSLVDLPSLSYAAGPGKVAPRRAGTATAIVPSSSAREPSRPESTSTACAPAGWA
jgi:hypothetical protein